MNTRNNKSERGQAIVLIAVAIVGLLGALALAVDGGMIMYDRRSAQNAADAAAAAAGYELANNPWDTATLVTRVQAQGLNRAADNGYSAPDKTVVVEYPPVAGTFHYVGTDTNVNNYVRVRITSPVDTSFVHFVYTGPVVNTVESVVHVVPPRPGPIYPGYGLVALAPSGCSMIYAGGTVNTNLLGGGIFVNSSSNSTSPSCTAMTVQSSSSMIYTPSLTVVGGISNAGGLIVQPGPQSSPAPANAVAYPPNNVPTIPTCAGPADIIVKNQTINFVTYDREMSPGYYNSAIPNKDIWLKPGIYCFNNGFSVNNNQHIGGQGVLLFISGSDPCNISWNGGATIQLKGYQYAPYKGLLMFINPRNFANVAEGPLTFNGNMGSYINGTIYAPTCAINMNGNGGAFYQGQIVGYQLTLLGGADINLQYVAGDNYEDQSPARVDQTQ